MVNRACILIAGESIEAKTHEKVTMLFSDIVGFTSICSTATPFMVVNMLQNLYTKFDAFCGQLDVYKVSDAISLRRTIEVYTMNRSEEKPYRADA